MSAQKNNSPLWKFTDTQGNFVSRECVRVNVLYFPLCNERIISSISPDLHGDIKCDERSFLMQPVSRIDLVNSRSSRNFWVYLDKGKAWSATGVSKDFARISRDSFELSAGLLWHKVKRANKEIGIAAETTSFCPSTNEPVELMLVTLANITTHRISVVPTAAIPMYARGAHNIRDHRHVTSLLQRITLNPYGVISKPTLIFDEAGHRPNPTQYFVLGWDENGAKPEYIYPTQEMFTGEAGDLEAPQSVLENTLPSGNDIQGRDAMGGLRFRAISLTPGASRSYIIVLGITDSPAEIKSIIRKFSSLKKINSSLEETKRFWQVKTSQVESDNAAQEYTNWLRWVSIQPTLRRIFGCSYLPDFDYGKGGRGWRDLWQDALSLLYTEPKAAETMLLNNFAGVRIDGSNATIIGKKPGEFVADRNNIARVWMDHGIWPLVALEQYLEKTADYGILLRRATYFCDPQIHRSRAIDPLWKSAGGNCLKTSHGNVYLGTILEHLLVQTLVQFFNVGEHNHVRLEGADWNDGLDMAAKRGESVAFSCMYARALKILAGLTEQTGKASITLLEDLNILLRSMDYGSVPVKQKALQDFFNTVQPSFSGKTAEFETKRLARKLRAMSEWMTRHIRTREWLKEGFFNGYYDNRGKRVEGKINGRLRMCLTSQVFAIMSGVASDEQVEKLIVNIEKHLYNKKLGGYHLNTDFGTEMHDLGRAFSFVYGDKENGAFFNHMVVMYAYALFSRGFAEAGEKVLRSIYHMATNTPRSKIYPCLPEYFNLQGRGMYSYLTGSASWYILCNNKFRSIS